MAQYEIMRHRQDSLIVLDKNRAGSHGGDCERVMTWWRPQDVAVATTFHPYPEETRQTTAKAVESGTPVVLITDSDCL